MMKECQKKKKKCVSGAAKYFKYATECDYYKINLIGKVCFAQQSGAGEIPDDDPQDQTVNARTVPESMAAGYCIALEAVQRAQRSVQLDDVGR